MHAWCSIVLGEHTVYLTDIHACRMQGTDRGWAVAREFSVVHGRLQGLCQPVPVM